MKKFRMSKQSLSTLGLLLITIWSAIQYLFLSNVPEDISPFAFLCVTNLFGFVILFISQLRHVKKLKKKTLAKGALLAAELLAMNFFLLMGSRGTDSIVISSICALYFVFVTPLLLLCRKRVSFRSAVATLVAVIALILTFNANMDGFFTSASVVYLIIGDVFFAGYVVTVSLLGGNEDSSMLAVSQMMAGSVLSFICWIVEVGITHTPMTLNYGLSFWVSVLFIGIFIRALYTVIQFACQKNVAPVNASLIFASEIVITLILNPVISKILGTTYSHATIFQIIGCVLFVVSVLICDDGFMRRFNYNDMDYIVSVDESGKTIQEVPLSRKIVNMNLLIGLCALIFSTVVCLISIYSVRDNVVANSDNLGKNAAASSEAALMEQLEQQLNQKSSDKAKIADSRLNAYKSSVEQAANYASELLVNPDHYSSIPVGFPDLVNGDNWVMQMTIANEDIGFEQVRQENYALGHMETLFRPMQECYPELSTVYIGTERGLLMSYDPTSGLLGNDGSPIYYEHREAEWYQLAKTAGEAVFTDSYQDTLGRGLTITCCCPIFDEDEEFIGAIGMDILMQDLNNQMVNDGIYLPEKAVLLDNTGIVIASLDIDPTSEDKISIYDKEYNSPLLPIADDILSKKDGMLTTGEGDDQLYVSFSNIGSTDWTLCIESPVKDIIEPAVIIKQDIDKNTEQVTGSIKDGIRNIIGSCLIFFAVIVLLITYFVGKVANKLTEPLKLLTNDVNEISNGNLNQRTRVVTHDEIGSLAKAFNDMTSSLQKYIVDLTDATAREERINSELSLATSIQASMLPNTFPAFPNRKEFDLYVTMHPAKEVGGDFYDYFLIDDTHLALVVADVSGKGVPAALFMVIAKTMIKNRTLTGGTPSEILAAVNNQLCETNNAEMFVTVWLGIIDLETGLMTATNAGHEFPIIKKKDLTFDFIKDKHGFVVAGMENSRYKDYEVQLDDGDILFLYTDGVTEAHDVNEQLFGNDNVINSLNSCKSDDCKQIIDHMHNALLYYMKDAPQFDDITMLCVRFDEFKKFEKEEKTEE